MSVENLCKLAQQVNLDGFWFKDIVARCKEAASRGKFVTEPYECKEEIPQYMSNKLEEEYGILTWEVRKVWNPPKLIGQGPPDLYIYQFHLVDKNE